jgi:hypothetical protein
MAKDEQQAAAQAQAVANHKVMNVNELKTLLSNPKADTPIFYGDHTKDSTAATFVFNQIKIAQMTYHWSDAAKAYNFKLVLRAYLQKCKHQSTSAMQS